MATSIPRELMMPLRQYGLALLAPPEGPGATRCAEPHAELLALVWGPRFDWEHAQSLLARQPRAGRDMMQMVGDAANYFDQLGSAGQQRVRQLIVRHWARWDNQE